jgi:hypothetical protein
MDNHAVQMSLLRGPKIAGGAAHQLQLARNKPLQHIDRFDYPWIVSEWFTSVKKNIIRATLPASK